MSEINYHFDITLHEQITYFLWMKQDDVDEEGCSPIFASLLYG